LHYDVHYLHAIVTQICGVKEFILFPPEDGQWLEVDSSIKTRSLIENPFDVDPAQHPRFSRARGHRATLNPGETVFVPSGWWHATRFDKATVTVSNNTVTSTNWMNWSMGYDGLKPGWKALAKRAYFRLAGLACSIEERATRRPSPK
jgi:hypothetical protein